MTHFEDKPRGETVRPYRPSDHAPLLPLLTELQSHVASLDPLKRQRTDDDFDAERYLDHLLGTLDREEGALLVAEEDGKPLGFIAGSIPTETEEDQLDHYSVREGIIHELVVSETARGRNIGKQLIEELESHFKVKGCDSVRVGCLVPNGGAHAFYKKCGYADRYVEMLKKI